MSADLVFWMGRFEARFPTDRRYAKNHLWALPRGAIERPGDSAATAPAATDGTAPRDAGAEVYRFGFTAYAVRLLQDVYFLDWTVAPGTDLTGRQEIGSIESKKAESALYAPLAGRLVTFNPALLSDPSAINVDPYGAGWLFEIQGDGSSLWSPAAYLEHLAAVWEVAQRTIKGQLNAEQQTE